MFDLLDSKIGIIITAFLTIFFGIYATPLDLFSKLIVDAIDTLVFAVTISAYIRWKRKLHWNKAVFYSGKSNKEIWVFLIILVVILMLVVFRASGWVL